MEASFELALAVGGAISGEHGIGTAKLPYSSNWRVPCRWSSCVPSSRPSTRPGSSALTGCSASDARRRSQGCPRERRPRSPLHARRCRRRRLLRQPGHVRDALRGRARRRAGHARHPLPLRRGRDRCGRRIWRVAGRPAATLLHLGPGLGNGLANLHNARRARTPIVNIVGDHATYHARYDAPLQSDIASIAGTVSGWYRSTARADDVAADGADAVAAALGPPGCVATLVLPADASWSESGTGPCPPRPVGRPAVVAADTITEVAKALRSGERCRVAARWACAARRRAARGKPGGRDVERPAPG